VEAEQQQDQMIQNSGTLYTTDEMRFIDSINQESRIQTDIIKKKIEKYKSQDYTTKKDDTTSVETNQNKAQVHPIDEGLAQGKSPQQIHQELVEEQLRKLDSMTKSRLEQTNRIVYEQTQNKGNAVKESIDKNSVVQTIVPDNSEIIGETFEVKKIKEKNSSYFNTLNAEGGNIGISAILDEEIKVVSGSRVRIRLLEEVIIGNYTIKQNACLYGIVKSFSEQRVKINITSILVDGHPVRVNLSVYDNDGIEGFYIPKSNFRDFTEEAGNKIANQSISIETNGGGIQGFAYKVLQDIYKAGTQAVRQNIRENKANLKYATQIYLVNNEEKQK
jgi:conjugative transposon TraM protein